MPMSESILKFRLNSILVYKICVELQIICSKILQGETWSHVAKLCEIIFGEHCLELPT